MPPFENIKMPKRRKRVTRDPGDSKNTLLIDKAYGFAQVITEHIYNMEDEGERVAYLVRLLWHSDYVWGGEHLGGTDCSGSICFALNLLGYPVRVSADYMMKNYCKDIVKEPQPGDLIFYLKSSDGRAYHVAVVSDNLNVLNAQDSFIDTPVSRSYVTQRLNDGRMVIRRLDFDAIKAKPVSYGLDKEMERLVGLFKELSEEMYD